MTTGIPALDFWLAGVISASLVVLLIAGRRYWIHATGRAKALPDLPQRDEATVCCADEGGSIIAWRDGEVVRESIYEGDYYAFAKTWPAPMQDNAQPTDWPKHFHDPRLPRRKGA